MSTVPGGTYTLGSNTITIHPSNHSHTLGSWSTGTVTTDSIFLDDTQNYVFASKLLGMYLEGKDLETDKKEYLDVIMRLPGVNNDTLKAVAVFERLKKISKVLCL